MAFNNYYNDVGKQVKDFYNEIKTISNKIEKKESLTVIEQNKISTIKILIPSYYRLKNGENINNIKELQTLRELIKTPKQNMNNEKITCKCCKNDCMVKNLRDNPNREWVIDANVENKQEYDLAFDDEQVPVEIQKYIDDMNEKMVKTMINDIIQNAILSVS